MKKLDTSTWKCFRIGDLFDKLQLDIKNEAFNKALDVSKVRTEEFNLPLVNAKHGNNGIMYYGREADFDTAEMTIDIVQNGAIATGDVYAQPQKTGVLWDAYLIKSKEPISSKYALMFMATVIEKAIKDKFSYDNKCIWDKASKLMVSLPVSANGKPDYAHMDSYMREIIHSSKYNIKCLRQTDKPKALIDVKTWKEFHVGDLFDVSRPMVRSQVQYEEGDVPFVASGNYNNGVIKWCKQKEDEILDPKGCISVSPLDGAAFYQPKAFLGRGGAGSAILLLHNDSLTEMSGLFIATILKCALTKFSYNDQINSQTILAQTIKLPITKEGKPDYKYMDACMRDIVKESESKLQKSKHALGY